MLATGAKAKERPAKLAVPSIFFKKIFEIQILLRSLSLLNDSKIFFIGHPKFKDILKLHDWFQSYSDVNGLIANGRICQIKFAHGGCATNGATLHLKYYPFLLGLCCFRQLYFMVLKPNNK